MSALVAAVVAGLSLVLSFPPYDVWWLAPVGVAALAVAAYGRGVPGAAGLGLLSGLVFFLPVLSWTNLHTGWLPWILLSTSQAVFFGLLAAVAAYATPLLRRYGWLWPPLVGLLWVAQEALRDRAPFGGFPWGRLAFSQGDSPLLAVAALGGAPLVTFGVGLAGGFVAAAFWRWRALLAGRGVRRDVVVAGVSTVAAPVVVAVGLLVPPVVPDGPRVTVAVVQGNVPRLGLDFNAQRRAVLDNHVRATERLASQVAAGSQPQPDLVVWPENSSDVDPLRDDAAAARIGRAAEVIDAPILVGAVLRGPGAGQVRNVGLLWWPDRGPDLDQLYVKRHPVPFAEYVPLRPIARLVSDEVDRVRADFVAGTRAGVVDAGPVTVGDVICFEVAYDDVVRDTVTGGAELLAVQTNNATFDEAEARQQLAMVRLRAVEHGRHALMASTVGVSAFVGADGTVIGATGFNTGAVVVDRPRLGAARTLATTLGYGPELGLVASAVGVLAGAVVIRRRRGRGGGDRRDVGGQGRGQTREGQAAAVSQEQRSIGGASDGYPGVGRVLVVIPTYNEVDNIRVIIDRVRRAVPQVDILVADDNSPDGTGAVADELAAADPVIHVLHRPGKQGLGAAYVAGFGWAAERGYDAVVEMDADGSHAPEELPRLLDALRDADAVIGSRWVRGGKVVNWPVHRLVLSRGANLYTRLALGMPYRDATGGYRAYRMPVLEKIEIESVLSQGYCFQVDLTRRAHQRGLRVVEVPITFAERERGASKMGSAIIGEAFWRVAVWGVRARRESLARRLGGRRAEPDRAPHR